MNRRKFLALLASIPLIGKFFKQPPCEDFAIGKWITFHAVYDGQIHDVIGFNHALTHEEVIWLYNNGHGRCWIERGTPCHVA